MIVTLDKVLTSDELAAICQQPAGANWATGLSAGAQTASHTECSLPEGHGLDRILHVERIGIARLRMGADTGILLTIILIYLK